MAECLFKTVGKGYVKDDVHRYILDMNEKAEKEIEIAREQIEIYKEETARLKAKLREKDREIKRLKKGETENA